ncbi:LOW QUALITY PROTEIN: hypothetical protein HID58_002322 [Brassica napus]|uniref:Uncharacterized protein n=1 Tax=Brassica napus TaxID=3708 RepID=A0ABQ8EPX2_BRANA|nr:LOW QUALITY PROTEIN: hypothetical protein HID58_002322 [Brassica napus]
MVVDKPGDPALRVVSYNYGLCLSSSKKGRLLGKNHLSVVKIAGSSGSAIDGPGSMAGVGRKFDGEAGNIGIKGDASDHTPGACAASVAILGLSSGRAIWFHESCGGVYGSIPRNSERENLSEAKDQEDKEGTVSMFVLVPGDNLVDSWYRIVSMPNKEGGNIGRTLPLILGHSQLCSTAICPSEVARINVGMTMRQDPRHALPKSGGLEIDLSETHRFEDIFVREPDGCVDLQGDLPVYLFDLKSSSSGRLSLIAWLFGVVSSFVSSSYPLRRLKYGTRCVRLVNLEYRDA